MKTCLHVLSVTAVVLTGSAHAYVVSDAATTCTAPEIVKLDNGTTTVLSPPCEPGPFLTPELVEVIDMDPSVRLDVRYATPNNFTGTAVYSQARVFLQKPAAEALRRAHDRVKKQGFGFILFDGYRPWLVTKKFWDITPLDKKVFVADPSKGSRHNRGCAIDLTLCDLETSKPVSMPTDYDDFSDIASSDYAGGTAESRRLRDILRTAMESEGFTVLKEEWWHFDFNGWKKYPIANQAFEELNRHE